MCTHIYIYMHTYTHGWVNLSMNTLLHIYKLLLHLGGVTFTCHHLFLTSHSPLKALTSFIPPKLLFSQVVKNLVIGKFKGYFLKILTPAHSFSALFVSVDQHPQFAAFSFVWVSDSLLRFPGCRFPLWTPLSFCRKGNQKSASLYFFDHCSSWTPVSRKMPWI